MTEEMLEKLAEIIEGLREILDKLEDTPDLKSEYLLDQALGNITTVYDTNNV
jgi:hypothetical protein